MIIRVTEVMTDANAGERALMPWKRCVPFEVCDQEFKVKPVGPVCSFSPITLSCLGTDMKKGDSLVFQHQGSSFMFLSLSC